MVRRVFIYGQFIIGAEALRNRLPFFPAGQSLSPPPLPPSLDLSTEAIEILREFSPLELIGKVYTLGSGRNYAPVTPLGVRNFSWYREYERASRKSEGFYFKVKDGDVWKVLWLRQESDDTGAYIAVALKHD